MLMKFRKVDESIYTRRKKISESEQLLKNFAKSGISVALVEGWRGKYKNVDSAYTSLYAVCKKHRISCKLSKRSGNLYLVNTKLISK